jgi:hypothetical protein
MPKQLQYLDEGIAIPDQIAYRIMSLTRAEFDQALEEIPPESREFYWQRIQRLNGILDPIRSYQVLRPTLASERRSLSEVVVIKPVATPSVNRCGRLLNRIWEYFGGN